VSTVPLQFRSADLVEGARKPRVRKRWHTLLVVGLALDAVFAVAVFGSVAVRAVL
jgi:hypothetical protein